MPLFSLELFPINTDKIFLGILVKGSLRSVSEHFFPFSSKKKNHSHWLKQINESINLRALKIKIKRYFVEYEKRKYGCLGPSTGEVAKDQECFSSWDFLPLISVSLSTCWTMARFSSQIILFSLLTIRNTWSKFFIISWISNFTPIFWQGSFYLFSLVSF